MAKPFWKVWTDRSPNGTFVQADSAEDAQAVARREGYGNPIPGKPPVKDDENRTMSRGVRRFSTGAPMNDIEMAAHFGFEPDDDAEKKLAKVCAKMAMPDDPAMMAADLEEDDEKAAMAADLGVPAKMSAIRAASVPLTTFTAMSYRLDALEAERAAEKEAAVTDRCATLADAAIKGGYPGDRAALIKFARIDFPAAEKLVKPNVDKAASLFSRVTNGGAPVGSNQRPSAPVAGGASKYGTGLADAIKLHRAAHPTMSYVDAASAVAKARPDLAESYLNGQ